MKIHENFRIIYSTVAVTNQEVIFSWSPYLFSRPDLEKCYHFTQLAIELNEMEEGVCPTDARVRPDQRHMEEGNWDDANKIKVLLEEKQRAARRKREAEVAEAAAEGTWDHGFIQDMPSIHPFESNVKFWQCKVMIDSNPLNPCRL